MKRKKEEFDLKGQLIVQTTEKKYFFLLLRGSDPPDI